MAGWRLSPAFDLNPMPGDRRESKTWLAEDSGPVNSKDMLLANAAYFRLTKTEADATWQEVESAVGTWRALARKLGMDASGLVDFAPAFQP